MVSDQTPPTQAKGAKVSGVFAAGLGSMATAGCLFWAGVLLSFTGIGMIVGIPLIVMAVVVGLFGPLLGFLNIKGPCPHCATELRALSTAPGVTCPGCQRRVVIRNKTFVPIP